MPPSAEEVDWKGAGGEGIFARTEEAEGRLRETVTGTRGAVLGLERGWPAATFAEDRSARDKATKIPQAGGRAMAPEMAAAAHTGIRFGFDVRGFALPGLRRSTGCTGTGCTGPKDGTPRP